MTSNDNFVTVEVFNARMDRLEAVLEKNLAVMQQQNAEFMVKMQNEMNNFKTEVRNDINDFKKEVHSEFDKVHAEIGVLQRDVEGLKHDVVGLYHWDYWLLSIILVVFAMPQIVAGVKSLFAAFTEGIAGIMTLFKQGSKKNE
ncbi:MAG: hypothetical protein IJP69_01655 [Synergistaceae bacterium]|nr:hypothetical protein [Synergistaceae bacterium]MBR0234075.1 hypothetical protein [Synergistaceae bacterium]